MCGLETLVDDIVIILLGHIFRVRYAAKSLDCTNPSGCLPSWCLDGSVLIYRMLCREWGVHSKNTCINDDRLGEE
jgi:hypothetical protein